MRRSCAMQLAVETMTAVRAVKPILPTKVGKSRHSLCPGDGGGAVGFCHRAHGPSLSGRARHRQSRARGCPTAACRKTKRKPISFSRASKPCCARRGPGSKTSFASTSTTPLTRRSTIITWCGTSGCRLCRRARRCWWTRCRCPAPQMNVQAIAVMPGAGREPTPLRDAAINSHPTSGYPPALASGDFVFIAGMTPGAKTR